jgi:acetyl esterase/lipase
VSLRMNLVAALVGRRAKNTADAASMEARVAGPRAEAPPSAGILKIADVVTSTVGGFEVLTVTPKSGASDSHIVYLHGGAYAGPSIALHWNIVTALVEGTGATLSFLHYGLAPQHNYVEAYGFIDAVMATIGSSSVFLAGDSAGGGLALGQAMRMRDAGVPPVAGVILFSPWVDVTMTNPDIAPIQPRDPMLGAAGLAQAGRWWAAPADPRTPLVSPLFGELGGLPPVTIFMGGRDILGPDTKLLADRIRAAGGAVDFRFYPTAFHVWVALPVIPEARKALREAAAIISRESTSRQ